MPLLSGSLKLNNLWRVIREIDLQAIRQQALSPFDLLVIAEPALAARLRGLLSPGGEAAPHAFVRTASAAEAIGATTPNAAIVLTAALPLDSATESAVHALRRARVPVAVAHVTGGMDIEVPYVAGHVAVRDVDARGAEIVANALLAVVPDEQRLAFAHQLPPFRAPYYELAIDETARANATYSLTTGLAETVPVLTAPLNLGDMIVLTKNQLLMSYRLVLASGRDGEPKKLITELLGVLGGGLLFRQLARQLVGLIPVVGLVPKVAVAYGGTWAIGRAVVLWVSEGREVTEDVVRSLGAEGLERGRAVAKDLVARTRSGAGRVAGRWDRLVRQLPGLSRRRRGDTSSKGSAD